MTARCYSSPKCSCTNDGRTSLFTSPDLIHSSINITNITRNHTSSNLHCTTVESHVLVDKETHLVILFMGPVLGGDANIDLL